MATSFKDFRDLLAYVEKRGQLRRVRVEVDPQYEIAAITARTARLAGGGPALLFERVKGSPLPVVTNLLGTSQRLAWGFGLVSLDELETAMQNLLRPVGPQDFGERLARLAETTHLSRYAPRTVRHGPSQEVVKQGSTPALLAEIPFLAVGPNDTGPALRHHPVFYRPQPDGPQEVRTASLLRHGENLYLTGPALESTERRQVSLVIGGDPALYFAVNAPFLPEIDLLVLAGALANRRLELVRGRTNDLEVPATAELILEGFIERPAEDLEVRLGGWNGYYATSGPLSRFTPTALTSRKDPLVVTPVVTAPPNEAGALVKGSERLLLPLLRQTAPEVTDLSLPAPAAFYNLAIVAIQKSYPGQAHRIMYNLWGQPQFKFLKNILVVDADCPLRQPETALAQVLALVDPARDLLVVKGPLDAGDLSGKFGSKLGIDATRKLPGETGESFHPDRQKSVAGSEEVQRLVGRKWLEYGIE